MANSFLQCIIFKVFRSQNAWHFSLCQFHVKSVTHDQARNPKIRQKQSTEIRNLPNILIQKESVQVGCKAVGNVSWSHSTTGFVFHLVGKEETIGVLLVWGNENLGWQAQVFSELKLLNLVLKNKAACKITFFWNRKLNILRLEKKRTQKKQTKIKIEEKTDITVSIAKVVSCGRSSQN